VQVLEAGHVAAHDDEVHALGVLDVEVAHGRPRRSTIRKASANALARRARARAS
jgi:hypothetical protein